MPARPTALGQVYPEGSGAAATHVSADDPGASPPYKWVLATGAYYRGSGTGSVDLTPLENRMTAAESTITSHTSTLSANSATISTHTATLSNHESRIVDLEPYFEGSTTISSMSTHTVVTTRAELGTDLHWIFDFVITSGTRVGQRGQADVYAEGVSGAIHVEQITIGPSSLDWKTSGESIVLENLTANNEAVKYWGFKKA